MAAGSGTSQASGDTLTAVAGTDQAATGVAAGEVACDGTMAGLGDAAVAADDSLAASHGLNFPSPQLSSRFFSRKKGGL